MSSDETELYLHLSKLSHSLNEEPNKEEPPLDSSVNEAKFDNTKPLHCGYSHLGSSSVFNKLCTAIMDKNWDLVLNVCEQCPDQVCQRIISKSNRTQAVYLSKLPIHFACKFDAPKEVIVTLLEIYPNGIKEVDEKGALPLHNLFHKKDSQNNNEECMEVVEYLVEKYPDSIRVADKKGKLPKIQCWVHPWNLIIT